MLAVWLFLTGIGNKQRVGCDPPYPVVLGDVGNGLGLVYVCGEMATQSERYGGFMKMKKDGFSAYSEIRALAERRFKGRMVVVQASIFGDEFMINVDGAEVIKGDTAYVREVLNRV